MMVSEPWPKLMKNGGLQDCCNYCVAHKVKIWNPCLVWNTWKWFADKLLSAIDRMRHRLHKEVEGVSRDPFTNSYFTQLTQNGRLRIVVTNCLSSSQTCSLGLRCIGVNKSLEWMLWKHDPQWCVPKSRLKQNHVLHVGFTKRIGTNIQPEHLRQCLLYSYSHRSLVKYYSYHYL